MSNIPLGATVLTDISRNRTVNVESTNVFDDMLSGTTVTPVTDVTYKWTNLVSTLTFKFVVSDINISFETSNAVSNTWTTEIGASETLLSGATGRIDIDKLDITSVNGGKFVDLTAGVGMVPIFTKEGNRIIGFDDLGELDGMTLGAENVAYILNGAGFTMNDMIVVLMSEINFIAQTGDHMTLTGTLLLGSFDKIVANPSTGDAVFNIDSSLVITNKITIRDCPIYTASGGTMFDAAGLDQTDPQVICFNNGNEIDSNWVGSLGFDEGSTNTVVALNTYTDIAGTMTNLELERFTRSGGELTYIGFEDIKVNVEVSLSIRRNIPASSSRVVRAAVFVDTGSGFVEQNNSFSATMVGTERNLSFQVSLALLQTDDIIKVQIKNQDTTDPIVVVDYTLTVEKL